MHCPVARELWNLVFIIRVAVGDAEWVVALLASWSHKFNEYRSAKI